MFRYRARISSLLRLRSSSSGDLGLPQLARRGLLGRLRAARSRSSPDVQQVVLHVLLGQRGRALHDVAGRRVGHHRADGALPVHALVLVEAPVLDRRRWPPSWPARSAPGAHLPVLVRVEEPGDRLAGGVGDRAGLRQRAVDQRRRTRRDAVADRHRRRAGTGRERERPPAATTPATRHITARSATDRRVEARASSASCPALHAHSSPVFVGIGPSTLSSALFIAGRRGRRQPPVGTDG